MQYMNYRSESTAALATEVVGIESQTDELDKIATLLRSVNKDAADRIWEINCHFENLGSNLKMELLSRYMRFNALEPTDDDGDDDSLDIFLSDEFEAWIKRHAERNK